MRSLSLIDHPGAYTLDSFEMATNRKWLNGAIYAHQHWNIANSSSGLYSLAHRVIALIEWVPLLGLVASRIEKAVAIYLYSSKGVEPPLNYPYGKLKTILETWCQEKQGLPEYSSRLYASEIIKKCYYNAEKTLDLSTVFTQTQQRLSSLPDLQSITFASLERFNCRKNALGTLPDFSHSFPALIKFYCSSNQLTALPNFNCNLPALQTFDCSSNQLIALPDFGHNFPALQAFNCSNNRLTTLPDFSRNFPALQTFDCSSNQLIALPDFGHNFPALQTFDCSSNQLIALPDFGHNFPALQGFNCSFNQLTALPDFSHNFPTLRLFYCSFNQLTALPDFSHNFPTLRLFYCSGNRLTTLPASLTQLPACCTLTVLHNQLSPAAIRFFQEQVVRARTSDPSRGPRLEFSIYDDASRLHVRAPLETTLRFWLKKFTIAFPKTAHEELWTGFKENQFPTEAGDSMAFYETLLSHEQKEFLNIFLIKLTETEDYKRAATQNNVIFKVMKMLEGAATYEKFRPNLFLILQDALSTCGDRVAFAFGKIELQRRLDCTATTLTITDLAKLLIGAERIDLLEAIARKSIAELGLGDHIEVFLFYQVRLKDELALPISTEGMLYPYMAGISEARLIAAKNEVLAASGSKEAISAILIKYDHWHDRLKKEHAEAFETIDTEITKQIEDLDAIKPPLNEYDKLTQIGAFTAKQKRRTHALLVTLTEQCLTLHLDAIMA